MRRRMDEFNHEEEVASDNIADCSEGCNNSVSQSIPMNIADCSEGRNNSVSQSAPMNESIKDEGIQTKFRRFLEKDECSTAQLETDNNTSINHDDQQTSYKIGADLNETVFVNGYENFLDHEANETSKKGCTKKPRFKRIRKLFRFVKGKRTSNDIDNNFRSALSDEELKEYNDGPPLQAKPTLQTEQTLNVHPNYIHHVESEVERLKYVLEAEEEKLNHLLHGEEERLKYLLARRSCHLPGNNWYQDWVQFHCNNHPLFGLCLRHELHPLSLKDRLFILMASISFGVIATNLVYLFFLTTDRDFEEDIFRLNLQVQEGRTFEVVLSSGIMMLLIFNGVLHVLFDFSLWHLSAATCCYHLKNHRIIKKHGTHAVLAIALFMFSFATLVIMVRMSYAVNEDEENEWEDVLKVETFFVVLGYMLQLSVVYFIFSPVLVTILFSGCLGCIPGMGGRPKDIQREINSMIQFQTKCNYRRDYSDTSENEYHFV